MYHILVNDGITFLCMAEEVIGMSHLGCHSFA